MRVCSRLMIEEKWGLWKWNGWALATDQIFGEGEWRMKDNPGFPAWGTRRTVLPSTVIKRGKAFEEGWWVPFWTCWVQDVQKALGDVRLVISREKESILEERVISSIRDCKEVKENEDWDPNHWIWRLWCDSLEREVSVEWWGWKWDYKGLRRESESTDCRQAF